MILVVEDKESMAQMLRETLEAEGYSIVIARDGQEGTRQIKENRFDLVLTDLKLPKKDGIEVLKTSKTENPLAPVIVMTAFGTIETAVAAMKDGAFDFITKPFDTDHLLLLMNRALETQRMLTENILLKDELSSKLGIPKIIGKSLRIHEVAQKVQKVAARENNSSSARREWYRERTVCTGDPQPEPEKGISLCSHKLCCNPKRAPGVGTLRT